MLPLQLFQSLARLAPAALAAAAGVTEPLVAAISGSALQAWRTMVSIKFRKRELAIEKGERVTTAGTSAKLDATLDQVRQQRTTGGRPIVAEFNNTFLVSRMMQCLPHLISGRGSLKSVL
jgi:hypothetical protein